MLCDKIISYLFLILIGKNGPKVTGMTKGTKKNPVWRTEIACHFGAGSILIFIFKA